MSFSVSDTTGRVDNTTNDVSNDTVDQASDTSIEVSDHDIISAWESTDDVFFASDNTFFEDEDQISLFDSLDEVESNPLFDKSIEVTEVVSETTNDNDETEEALSEIMDNDDIAKTEYETKETTEPELVDEQVTMDQYAQFLEDLKHVPSVDSSLGNWAGARGDSDFFSAVETEAYATLQKLGLSSIPYKEGHPDFSSCEVATIYLTEQEMKEMSDYKQKQYANYSLTNSIDEDEDDLDYDGTDEEPDKEIIETGENIETKELDDTTNEVNETEDFYEDIRRDIVDAICEDPSTFYTSLLEGKTPQGFCWHHGELIDGMYNYKLMPEVIHSTCIHSGGRSHSKSKR